MQALVLLIIVLVGGWMLHRAWSIWKENFLDRRQLERSREQAFLAEVRAQGKSSVPSRTGTPPPSAILDAPARALLHLLRLELREHEILAAVDVATLFGGNELPPRTRIDYLVCRRDFTPLAAIFVERGQSDALRERAMRQVAARGVRILRWGVDALPARAQIVPQVLGEAGGQA